MAPAKFLQGPVAECVASGVEGARSPFVDGVPPAGGGFFGDAGLAYQCLTDARISGIRHDDSLEHRNSFYSHIA